MTGGLNRQRGRNAPKKNGAKGMLKGDLSSFSLGEILQSLTINNHTGTLRIADSDGAERLIFFSQGEISLFSNGPTRNLRIGEVLVRLGVITSEDLDEALRQQREVKKLLGQILLDDGKVSESDIRRALTTKIQEEIYDLFLWTEGVFEFHMGECPEDDFDGLQRSLTVKINTNSVIMEGLRRLDEWSLIRDKIRTFQEIFIRDQESEDDLDTDEASALEQVDGESTVEACFEHYFGTRFQFCKALCSLWERGLIRPLSSPECQEAAAAYREKKRFPQAIACLTFAAVQQTDEPAILDELAEVYAENFQDAESRQARISALRLYFEQDNVDGIKRTAQQLMPGSDLEARDLEIIFNTLLQSGDIKGSLEAGTQLATALQKQDDLVRAVDVLKKLERVAPKDLNVKIQIGCLLDKTDRSDEARTYLNEVAEVLENEKKYKDLLKVLRLLLTIAPDQPQLKERIATIQGLIDKLAQRRKKRFTILVGSVAAVVLLSITPILYEFKARELYAMGRNAEEIAEYSKDYDDAKNAYSQLINEFGFSSVVGRAQEALERITEIQALTEKETTERQERKIREHQERMRDMRRSFDDGLSAARATEANGSMREAHARYLELLHKFPELSAAQHVQLPLRIASQPPGAEVFANGTKIGSTPHILHYVPGAVLQLELRRHGCKPFSETLELTSQWEVRRMLTRKALVKFAMTSPVEQPFLSHAGIIVFPSRDGNVYAFNPTKQETLWQIGVGRFGDRISDLSASYQHIYLSTVTGELACLSLANGKSNWVGRVEGPVLGAPAISDDRRHVAVGTLSGFVHVVDNSTGKERLRFKTENTISCSPVFVGDDLLVAGSHDNHLYAVSPTHKQRRFTVELTDDVTQLIAHKDAVLAVTKDGLVHKVSAPTGAKVWSRSISGGVTAQIAADDDAVYCGSGDARLTALGVDDGEPLWSVQLGTSSHRALTLIEGRVYLGSDDGRLSAFDVATRSELWHFKADGPIHAPLVVVNNLLCVGSLSGTTWLFEVLR